MMSILERGSAVVIIDNVDTTLRSPALSAVLTARAGRIGFSAAAKMFACPTCPPGLPPATT